MRTATLRVGYAGLHMGAYFAEEYNQFGRAISGLERYAALDGFELVPAPSWIRGREDAAAARRFFSTQDLDFLLVHAATCSLADPLMELASLGIPLGIWGVPEPTLEGDVQLNSFITLQIFASTLRSYIGRGNPSTQPLYKWFFGDVDDPVFADRLGVTIRALHAARALRGARIGLVGDLAPGFYGLSFDEAVLRSRFDVEIVRHPVQEVLAKAEEGFSQPRVSHVQAEMSAAARAVLVDEASMERSARVYLALKELAESYKYQAMAVRDWPEFQTLYGLSPLLSMAWLTERDDIPVACEGDVLGSVSMIALSAISGAMPTLVDLGPIDPATGGVLLWHLGSSPHRLADDDGVTYKVHSTLGRNGGGGPWGVVADQVFRPGPVTVMSLSRGGTDLFVFSCRIEARPSRGLSGDRGWSFGHMVDGELIGVDDLVNTVLVAGLAHHCAFVPGDWTAELTELGAWLRLGTVQRIRASRALQVDWRTT